MKRTALVMSSFVLVTLMACNNGRSYNPDTQINYPQATQPANVNPVQGDTANKQPANVNVPPMTTLPLTPANTSTTAAGLNPAHGQPGHRCDIAVGAPLNSKPAATTTTTPTTTSTTPSTTVTQPVTINPQPAAQKTAPGMNPPHGQPGHRCDIAVGAPLNSKPAATTPQVTPLQPQPMPVTPVLPTPVKTDSSGKQ